MTVRKVVIIRTVHASHRAELLANRRLQLVAPAIVNRTVRPTRRPNHELRSREHLTEAEIEKLLVAARGNRYGHRDATMLLVAYRHGLRSSELVDLRWEQVDFASATLHVRRVKDGTPATHPIIGDELRALRRLQREKEPRSPFAPRSAARRSRLPGSLARSCAPVEPRGCRSRYILTGSATPAASRRRTRAMTHAPCRPTSGTRTSSTRCAIPSWHRRGSRISGDSKPVA